MRSSSVMVAAGLTLSARKDWHSLLFYHPRCQKTRFSAPKESRPMFAKLAFVFSIYLLSTLSVRPMTPAQQSSASLKASALERTKEGDQPDNPGPIATDLSSKL